MSDAAQQTPAETTVTADVTKTGQTETPKGETTSQTTETKPEPTKTADAAKTKDTLLTEGDKKEGDKPVAPEKYEAFKLPDGFQIAENTQTEINTVFKELGLTQEAGQKLIDLYTKTVQGAKDEPLELWQKQQTDWQDEVKADKDIGHRLPEVKQKINGMLASVLDAAQIAALKEALNFTGAGNNPAIIRAMWTMAQKFGEGTPVKGGNPTDVKTPGAGPKTAAQAMYPNLP